MLSYIFPATVKSEVDWETLNKLVQENVDMKNFVDDLNVSIPSNSLFSNGLDKVY
jgi:hypothetical protein